jgi:transcriptional regulator with XRE-family HTH domain
MKLETSPMNPSETPFFKAFGQRIAALRKNRGLTQSDLADTLGLDQTAIASYEVGRRRVPLSLIAPLAQALGVSVGELIVEENPNSKPGPTPKLQRQIEQVGQLTKGKQKFVSDFLETVLAGELAQAKAS